MNDFNVFDFIIVIIFVISTTVVLLSLGYQIVVIILRIIRFIKMCMEEIDEENMPYKNITDDIKITFDEIPEDVCFYYPEKICTGPTCQDCFTTKKDGDT